MSEYDEALRAALEKLVEELEDNHLPYLQHMLEAINGARQYGHEELRGQIMPYAEDLAKRFHRIKGGAGFLECDELIDIAQRGEALFKGPSIEEESPEKISKEFATMVEELSKTVNELRKEFKSD